jgi:hypothetical protein
MSSLALWLVSCAVDSAGGCLTFLLNGHKWWRLRGVDEQINLKVFHSHAHPGSRGPAL